MSSKSKNFQLEFPEQSKFTDKIFNLYKKLDHNPESRHEKLPSFAKYSNWCPGYQKNNRDNLDYVIKFNDRSNPLYLGSPVILSAGGNKFGENIADFAKLGFGGITLGTATRNPREGNPFRPRIAMIPDDFAINNSMGLNNPGIDALTSIVDRDLIKAHKNQLSVGISIAESPDVNDEKENLKQTLYSFRKAYNTADYVEINVSCPNTGNARIDTQTDFMSELFKSIKDIRKQIPVRKAVYAKLSPDMSEPLLLNTLDILKQHGINGLVLFNTFPSDKAKFLKMKTPVENLITVHDSGSKGGISGKILYKNTIRAVEYIKNKYPDFSIIASGGVDHGLKIRDLFIAGADAVQAYSVLAYRYFGIQKMNLELLEYMKESGYPNLNVYLEKKIKLSG